MIEPRQREFDAIVGLRPGDYATLTAALADGHRSVFIRAGTYAEPASVTLTSGMWICGESRDNTVLAFGANQLLINEAAANYADHALIENLSFTGININGLVLFQRARYCTIQNCLFDGSAEAIESTSDSMGLVVADNVVNSLNGGIILDGPIHTVRGNRLLGGASIRLNNQADGSIVEGNFVESTNQCIWIDGPDHVRVVGNHLKCSVTNGVTLGADGTVFDGNTVIDCAGAGVVVTGNHVVVSNNEIAGIAGAAGVYVGDPYVVIEGNSIHDNAGNGVEFDAADYGIVHNNQIIDNGGDGIEIPAGSDQINVGGNMIRGNTGWGIDFASDRCTILGNTVLTNTAGQIDNTGATNQIDQHNMVA